MPRPTSPPGLVRQQRFQHCPFLVTQVSSSHGRPLWRTHRILGTRPSRDPSSDPQTSHPFP
jgi:hypothetical protein